MQVESSPGKVDTRLAIIIDPPDQTPKEAALRVDEFIQRGGNDILIGGSGIIESNLFQDTVRAVTDVATRHSSIPVWILPGHLDQIPVGKRGVSGVLNYQYIMGSGGNDFDAVYPENARKFVSKTLKDRQIPSISTLYILCGDPNASVSRVSGILPLDFASLSVRERFLEDMNVWLARDIECVFFESGSNTLGPMDRNIVIQTRQMIDSFRTETSLFVSGGIRNPVHARLFAGIADYVVVGGYFERNGVKEVADFLAALKV